MPYQPNAEIVPSYGRALPALMFYDKVILEICSGIGDALEHGPQGRAFSMTCSGPGRKPGCICSEGNRIKGEMKAEKGKRCDGTSSNLHSAILH